MDTKKLEEQLKSFQDTQNPNELLDTIFDLLSKNPSWEEQDLLELWLMTYSFEDPDRVAEYWKSQLDTGSKIRQRKATTFLTVMAKTNITARNILRKFLESIKADEDPAWENLKLRFNDLDK